MRRTTPSPSSVSSTTPVSRSRRRPIALGGALLTGGLLAAVAAPAGPATACCGPTDPVPTITMPPITLPPPPTSSAWFIDANTVTVVDAQEEAIYSNGDELYLAQIGFRSTPGRTGSTTAWYLGTPSSLPGLDDGDSRAIPDAMGRVPFASVTLRDAGDVLAGHLPEVIGSITVAIEDDGTPSATIDHLMAGVRDAVRTEVAKVIEPLTIADLGDTSSISQQLGAAARQIQDATRLTAGEQIRLFFGSFFDPDDLIDVKANVFVAVDADLAPLVDEKLSSVPPSVGKAGALRDRTYTQRFTGDGAVYDVTFHVSK